MTETELPLFGILSKKFNFFTDQNMITPWRIGTLKYLEIKVEEWPSRAKWGQAGPNGAKWCQFMPNRVKRGQTGSQIFHRLLPGSRTPSPIGFRKLMLIQTPSAILGTFWILQALNPCHPQCKLMKIGNDPYQCLVKVKGIFWNINPPQIKIYKLFQLPTHFYLVILNDPLFSKMRHASDFGHLIVSTRWVLQELCLHGCSAYFGRCRIWWILWAWYQIQQTKQNTTISCSRWTSLFDAKTLYLVALRSPWKLSDVVRCCTKYLPTSDRTKRLLTKVCPISSHNDPFSN